MKRKHLKSLKLNKKSISNLQNELTAGYNAQTCEAPCQGGTTCCSAGGHACEADKEGGTFKLPVTSFRSIFSCVIC